jgi:hypothetical protein
VAERKASVPDVLGHLTMTNTARKNVLKGLSVEELRELKELVERWQKETVAEIEKRVIGPRKGFFARSLEKKRGKE